MAIIAEIRQALAKVRHQGYAPFSIHLNPAATGEFVDEARRMLAWGNVTPDLAGCVFDGVPVARNFSTDSPRVQIFVCL